MTIYDSSGAIVYEAPITASAVIKRVLMGDYYIELTFDAVERVDVGRGCYILYNGHKFEIISNVLPDDTNNGGLRYTLRFEAQQSQMKRCKVFWRAGDNLEVSFSNTTSIDLFAELITSNVNAFLGSNNWYVGSTPPDLEKTLKTVSFNGDTCWDAVANIAGTFGVEWWTEEDGDNVSLCFGKLEYGDEVEFKKGDIVSSIPSKKGDSANYGTRFYVFGSTKNLPADYDSTEEGGIVNHIVEKRLHLPDGKTHIDAWDNLAQEDIVEQVVYFDDIFPTNVDTVTRVDETVETVIEGRYDYVYTLYCEDTPFTPDNIIEGEQIQANFTSGDLIGQTFDVEVNTTSFDKRFRIVPNVLDVENGILLPNDSLKPKEGDTFILTGITLPDGRVKEAEQSLLEAGVEYAKKNSNDTEVYDCPTNAVYCHQNGCNYDLGQKVILIGDKFGGGRSSRIQGYEKKLYDEYQATYTIGDNSAYSRLSSVEKAIQKSSYADRVGLEANIIRAKSDSTIPSDYNVYSALATLEYFLHKNRGGIVKGHTAFERGISLYGKMIKYDANKDALIFPFNVVVEKEVAWNSSPDGFDVPTFMDAVRVDNITIKKENGVLTVIGGAGGSGGGVADSVLWSGIVGKPTTIEGYGITDAYTKAEANSAIDNRINALVNGAPSAYDTLKEIADVLAGNVDSIGDILTSLGAKANKATTLAGYGIVDAYTKTQVDSVFAKQSDVTEEFKKYVTLSTDQNVTGIKNFINGFKIGGKSVTYNAEKNALVFPVNAIFEGEVAWNSTLEGFDVPTIMDAIQVDGVHIKKDKGYLEFVGEVGGGIDESQLGDYLTRNSYAKKSDIPSLSGYATESWVTGKGYITGISGSMVIAALGYTPYNSANFTKATIKSTLGISDWALASVKPSYSWSEIGSRPTALSQFSNDSGFITNNVAGDFSASGMVRGNYLSTGYIQISSNIDASLRTSIFGDAGNHWGQIKAFRTGGSASYGSLVGGYAAGILFAMNDTHGFIQLPEAASKAGEAVIGGGTGENIKWSAKLLHSLNYSSYALPITGGTINGSLTVTASVTAPTFVGSLSGIADNSTQLNGLGANYYVKSPSSYDFASFNSGLERNAIYEYRAGDGLSYAGDPVGSGYGVLMNIRDCRGYDGFQFLSTAASAWNKTDYRLLYRGKARSTSMDMSNGWSEIPLMDMSGNLVIKGEVSWHSSRVLKNIVNDEPTYLSMADMLKIKPYRYTWKDGRDDKVHAGGIADEVLEVLPEVIITDSEGIHAMDYGQASFTVATSLTPHVNRHEEEIDALKRRVKELEDLVTKLLNKYGDL